MKFDQPLSHPRARALSPTKNTDARAPFAALYFRLVPPGSVSDKWTVARSLPYAAQGEQGASEAASWPRYKIGGEHGRSVRNDPHLLRAVVRILTEISCESRHVRVGRDELRALRFTRRSMLIE